MREFLRLVATTIIWSVFLAIVGVSLSTTIGPITQMNGGEIVALVAILMVGAVAMTYAVWHSGFQLTPYRDSDGLPARSAKPKRNAADRIERLIAELDDDEIYRLESLLLGEERSAQRRQPRE